MSNPTPKPSRRARLSAELDSITSRLERLERAAESGSRGPGGAPQVPGGDTSRPEPELALAQCTLELSAARSAAERADRQRLELFGLLNREIRTPLAGLLGIVGLLGRQPLDVASKEYVANIEACGEEVLELLNQALTLSDLPAESLEAVVAARRELAASHARATAADSSPAAPADPALAPPRGLPTPGARKRVLVVEDNVINQKVAQKLLERAGVEVELAANGLDALTQLERSRFDLVLMDCEMPVLDGYAATRDLRRNERARALGHTPVIALTASCLPEERLRCFEAGMDDFLAKPASTDVLLGKLRQWLPELRPTVAA